MDIGTIAASSFARANRHRSCLLHAAHAHGAGCHRGPIVASLVVACALAAAFLFALASVLQHSSASLESQEHNMRLSLLTRLVRQPLWLIGILADVGAYVLQFVALGHGSLVLVQPLLVAGLLFALPMSAALNRQGVGRTEWLGAAGIVVGLALFFMSANPGPGHPGTDNMTWVLILVAIGAPSAVLVGFAGPSPSTRRAVMLGGATGLLYGLTAAITKSVAHLLSLGIVHLVVSWQTYALVVVGLASLVVAQSAFQAGPLRASLPILSVLDPVVSIVIGALAFGEGLAGSAPRRTGEVVGLIVLSFSVVLLSRSRLMGPESEIARP